MERYSRSPKTDKDLKPCKIMIDNIALQYYDDTRDKTHNQNILGKAVANVADDYFYIEFAEAQFQVIGYINYIIRSLPRMENVKNILVKTKGNEDIKKYCITIIDNDIKELILKIEIMKQIGIVWGLKSFTRASNDFNSQLEAIVDEMRDYINFSNKFISKELEGALKKSLKRKDKKAPLVMSYYFKDGFFTLEDLIEVYND